MTAYSLRESLARELRTRGVPQDQLELMLQHKLPEGHSGTSRRCAPYDPALCRQDAETIDQVMEEVQQRCTRARIIGPAPKLHTSQDPLSA